MGSKIKIKESEGFVVVNCELNEWQKIYLNGQMVSYTDNDMHGYSGMEESRMLVRNIADVLGFKYTDCNIDDIEKETDES